MKTLTILAMVWLVLMLFVARGLYGPTVRGWARAIAFKPTERMSADDLFDCLLSANLALLERDDFNQLGSALGRRRVEVILANHWRVHSRNECLRAIEQRMRCLGVASASEEAAAAAWLRGAVIPSPAYDALRGVLAFLEDEGLADLRRVSGRHLTPMASDIQQVAYLARLGFSAGHLSREYTREVLNRLRRMARAHYTCWEMFSLSALIGMGLRNGLDPYDLGAWPLMARSHRVLRAAQQHTLRHASPWANHARPERGEGEARAAVPSAVVRAA